MLLFKMYKEVLCFILLLETVTALKCLFYDRTKKKGVVATSLNCAKDQKYCDIRLQELPKGQRAPGDIWVPFGACRREACTFPPEPSKDVYYHCCNEDLCNIVPHQLQAQPITPRFIGSASQMSCWWAVFTCGWNIVFKIFL